MFTHPRDDWACYLLAVALTLAWKLIRYIRAQKAQCVPARRAAWNWFFEGSAENAVSWITTAGVIWVVADCYMRRVEFLGGWLQSIPIEKSIAFLLGSVVEIAAPNAAKWILSKLPAQG